MAECDEAAEELLSIQAIFPEIELDSKDARHAILELEVCPSTPLEITFKPSFNLDSVKSLTIHDDSRTQPESNGNTNDTEANINTHEFTHLPCLHVDINLPAGYPDDAPPQFRLRTAPPWIPVTVLDGLEAQAKVIWEDYGRTQTVYAYIDYLQTAIEGSFSLTSTTPIVSNTFEQPLLSHQAKALQARFAAQTYDCGVCLYPKKGSSCHAMRGCGHVFCKECLNDFYSNAITEGSLETVQCLDPDCGAKKKRRSKAVHPMELLEIGIAREQAQRYVDLKLKKMLESDKSIDFCPRFWCQGPARSAKYLRYNTNDLETWPEEDETVVNPAIRAEDQDDGAVAKPCGADHGDRLRICSACSFAFCHVCNKSWHGDYVFCLPPRDLGPGALSAEEKASLDFIRMNTSPCPSCNTPTQKQMGCNHMICSQCDTHYCYLCSSWLNPDHPYSHFNNPGTSCHMRLFELEEGDDGQAGAVFGGARAAEQMYIEAVMDAAAGGAGAVNQHNHAANVEPAIIEPADQPEHYGVRVRDPGRRALRPRANLNRHPNGRHNRRHGVANEPPDIDAVDREALQRFLEMAAVDEEDGWDSDEWDVDVNIPVHRRGRAR